MKQIIGIVNGGCYIFLVEWLLQLQKLMLIFLQALFAILISGNFYIMEYVKLCGTW